MTFIGFNHLGIMTNMEYWKMIRDVCHKYSILAAFPLSNVVCKEIVYDCHKILSNSSGTVYQWQDCVGVAYLQAQQLRYD